MTIRKGQEWGRSIPRPPNLMAVENEHDFRHLVEQCRHDGEPIPPVVLREGGLARTIGSTDHRGDTDAGTFRLLPIDLGRATLDGTRHWFTSHLVARGSWWRGQVVTVMNAQFIGRWDVAPRSHPNDGRLDVLEAGAEFGFGPRWHAWRRLPLGLHVPHPALSERRVTTFSWQFARPLNVWLDGDRVGRCRQLDVEVEPDAASICVAG